MRLATRFARESGRSSVSGATGRRCTWRVADGAGATGIATLECPEGTFPVRRPAASARPAPGTGRARPLRPHPPRRARHPAMARPRPPRLRRPPGHGPRALCVPFRRRRRAAPDPRRPRPCRHHRAGSLPFHRQRGDNRAAGGPSRLRSQGHRGTDVRCDAGGGRPARRPDLRRQHRRLCACLLALRPRPLSGSRFPAAPSGCGRSWRNSSGLQTTSATSARSATTPPSR